MENLPSASSPSRSIFSVYDVFINHRGPDVKITLAEPLYRRLRDDLNLQVFLDREELQMGDIIPSSIAHAIKNASVHIAIFSKNYAQSWWCLEELRLMLDSGAVILPVFYDVKPSDLRRIERGVYADAFRRHKRKKRCDAQTLQRWKQALDEVSYRTGLEFDSTSDEDCGSLLQRVVNTVSKHVKMDLDVADYPVGLDDDIEKFETTMAEHENQGENMVKVVGIFGMGGTGKTTLAKELHNRKKSEYGNKSCFLFDVRESSVTKGLHYLQSMLLKELGFSSDTIYSSNRGKEVLRKQLRGKRVFIVLDDIDHADQLEALLVQDVLGSDSLVLITSRYKNVLIQCGIPILHEKKGMDPNNGRQLFCWHAFQRRHPMNGFEDLVERFLDACSGLPLSLKVIARQLRGKLEKTYWEGELQKIRKTLPADITKILKISYDALDEEQKEIFLDIACFFVGENKSKAVSVWEASEWNGLHALQVLEDRCLVEFHETQFGRGTFLRMHDHLRDMGREIAKSTKRPRFRHSIDNGNDRSNFFALIKQPSEDALSEVVGSRMVNRLSSCFRRYAHSLVLQLLAVDGNRTTHKFVTLLWLRWWNYPCERLPSFLSLENLRVLEIYCPFGRLGLKELWDDRTSQAPLHLRELYMTSSITLEKITKSVASLVYLRKLVLQATIDLASPASLGMELPDVFCSLRSLEHLNLRNYRELRSLPTRFGDLTNLQHLDLSLCRELQTLPDSFSKLTQLRCLSFSHCSRLIVPQDMFGNISRLEHLDFSGCKNLKVLPIAITRQRYLRTLRVWCTKLPDEIGELRNLEVLDVGGEFLTMLPSSLGNLCRLKELKLSSCRKLRSLPESVGLLKRLETLNIFSSGVERLPEGVAHLNNLQELYVSNSPIRKVTLRKSGLSDENCMFRLKRIELSSTETTFISIGEHVCPNLSTLEIHGCPNLKDVELALPTTLMSLNIRGCQVLKRITGLSDLTNLRSLSISECVEVEKLPSLAHLTSLNELVISGCGKLENIQGAGDLSSLKVLDADSCWNLQSIEGLDRLQGLNRWQISSDKWTDIGGLLRSCVASSASILTTREVAGDDDNSGLLRRESIRNFLSFPPTATVKCFSDFGGWTLRLSKMEANTCSTLVTFFVFRSSTCASMRPSIWVRWATEKIYETKVKEGRWMSVGVFAKNSDFVRNLKAASDDDGEYLVIEHDRGLEIEVAWTVLVADMVEVEAQERENISKIWTMFFSRVYSSRHTLPS